MAKKKSFKPFTLHTPATSANLGSGFDTCGLAIRCANRFHFKPCNLDQTQNQLTITPSQTLKNLGFEQKALFLKGDDNLVMKAYHHACEQMKWQPQMLDIECDQSIALKAGLGSSASAILAGIGGAFVIEGCELNSKTKSQILNLSLLFENHIDNTGPCLYGGFCAGIVKKALNPKKGSALAKKIAIDTEKLEVSLLMFVKQSTDTQDSRKALPTTINRSDVTFNSQRLSWLNLCFAQGDYLGLRLATQDRLHQPFRLKPWHHIEKIWEDLKQHKGFFGLSLSGSGPTLLVMHHPDFKVKDAFKNELLLAQIAKKEIAIAQFGICNDGLKVLEKAPNSPNS